MDKQTELAKSNSSETRQAFQDFAATLSPLRVFPARHEESTKAGGVSSWLTIFLWQKQKPRSNIKDRGIQTAEREAS